MERSNYFYGLARLWWLPLLSGLVFLGFGVWCLCDPSQSFELLAYIFAGLIGAVGIFNLVYGLSNINSYHGWGWAVAGGIVEILFSIFLFFVPGSILAWVFGYGVGLYIIFMAIYSFFDGFMMSRFSSSWFACLLVVLLAALAFAFIFILSPIGPAVVGWIWLGISFLCYGAYKIGLAFRIRQLNKKF